MTQEQNFIYQTNNENKTITSDTNEYYTISDYSDFLDGEGYCRSLLPDSDFVYAKKITRDDQSVKYMVKIDTRGKLFNPMSIYGKDSMNTFLDKTCKDTKFKTVNLRTFDMYIKFLSTKNLSWLHNAEREAE